MSPEIRATGLTASGSRWVALTASDEEPREDVVQTQES